MIFIRFVLVWEQSVVKLVPVIRNSDWLENDSKFDWLENDSQCAWLEMIVYVLD